MFYILSFKAMELNRQKPFNPNFPSGSDKDFISFAYSVPKPPLQDSFSIGLINAVISPLKSSS